MTRPGAASGMTTTASGDSKLPSISPEKTMTTLRPPPLVELRHLHAFLVVAEELHFGRAAIRLGIAQPPLSQQIKRIERVLGHPLFVRDTRNVSLTPAGEAFVETARMVLQQLALGIERSRAVATGDAGRLAVGFTPTTALRLLPAIVHAFRGDYARVEIALSEMMPDALIEGLRRGEIDLALLRDARPIEGAELVTLHTEPFVAVLPAGHPLTDPAVPFDLAAMAGDPFVLFPRNPASHSMEAVIALCVEAGFTPRVVQEVPGWQTAIAMVGSGLGVTILPESVDSLKLPGIVYRRIESPIRSIICAARRIDDERPMVRNFIERGASVMPT
jgi:DNA-binding transcriptional LysR family regulator